MPEKLLNAVHDRHFACEGWQIAAAYCRTRMGTPSFTKLYRGVASLSGRSDHAYVAGLGVPRFPGGSGGRVLVSV